MKRRILNTAVLLADLASVPAIAQTTPDPTKQGNALRHPADATKQPTQSMAHPADVTKQHTQSMAHAPTRQAARSLSHANPATGDTELKQH